MEPHLHRGDLVDPARAARATAAARSSATTAPSCTGTSCTGSSPSAAAGSCSRATTTTSSIPSSRSRASSSAASGWSCRAPAPCSSGCARRATQQSRPGSRCCSSSEPAPGLASGGGGARTPRSRRVCPLRRSQQCRRYRLTRDRDRGCAPSHWHSASPASPRSRSARPSACLRSGSPRTGRSPTRASSCSAAPSRGRLPRRSVPCTSGRALRPTDPVFLRLVHGLSVRFSYRVHSRHPAAFAGDAALDALLSDGTGWSRRLVVVPRRAFHGTHITLTGKLDLAALTRAVTLFEAKTGVHNPAYHVELAPRVRVHGVAGGRAIREAFAPSLAFDLDELAASARAPARRCRVECARPDEIARRDAHDDVDTRAVRSPGERRRRARLRPGARRRRARPRRSPPARSSCCAARRRAGDDPAPASATSSSPWRPACSAARVRAHGRDDRRPRPRRRALRPAHPPRDACRAATRSSSTTRGSSTGTTSARRRRRRREIRLDAVLRPRPSHLQAADR